jgi:hypothetical protein
MCCGDLSAAVRIALSRPKSRPMTPEDLPPSGWMETQMMSGDAFRRHYERQREHYRAAQSALQFREPILPYHYDVLTTASDFARGGMPDVAVIMAQTACEIATEAAIDRLFRRQGLPQAVESWIRERIERSSTFRAPTFYGLYRALSGDDFKATKLWTDLDHCIGIRNGVVHEGRHATAV